MSRATIKDVADYARVSNATVSRVLNNNPQVDEILRARVLAAVEALGYEPNRDARRLRARSSNVIGLVISDIQNPYFISVIRGVEDAAYSQQMNIVLCNSDEDVSKQAMYLRVMEAERVAGLIIVPCDSQQDEDIQQLQKIGIPIILLDRALTNVQMDAVLVDNVRGAYEAVRHLLDLGYRSISLIGGSSYVTTGQDRYLGYHKALKDAGLPIEDSLVKSGDFKMESGYRLARELMAASHRPEAIFVANNLMTLGALRALRELRLRVPEDVALVGFDDMPWSGELYSPLTAVSQPTYELGQEAVHLLLRRLAAPEASFRTTILQTRLIVRESSGVHLPDRSIRHG
jgi:DNA-binding LacI/PurR family transcriptional regulator